MKRGRLLQFYGIDCKDLTLRTTLGLIKTMTALQQEQREASTGTRDHRSYVEAQMAKKDSADYLDLENEE
jgi:hypothetical protein